MFVTHGWSASIAAHYARLQREAGPMLDVYLVVQAPVASAISADERPYSSRRQPNGPRCTSSGRNWPL